MDPVLAQVNVALMRADLDSAEMAGFVAALDPVYRLAEASPGFVWRQPALDGHGALAQRDDDGALFVVNLSVWVSYEALHAFTYRSTHMAFVRRRAEWFLPSAKPSTALWWVPSGVYPSVPEALARLRLLRREGPSPRAFPVRRRFTPDGRPVPAAGARPRR